MTKQKEQAKAANVESFTQFSGYASAYSTYLAVMEIVNSERKISARRERIEDEIGLWVDTYSMGSGGVGQTKLMSTGDIRIQIGAAYGKWNYAMCAVIQNS